MPEKILMAAILIVSALEGVVIALTKVFSASWAQTFQQSHFVALCCIGLFCNLVFFILIGLQKFAGMNLGGLIKYEGLFSIALAFVALGIFAMNGFRW